MAINKNKVSKLLVSFGADIKGIAPVTPEGNLDVAALQNLPQTIGLIQTLKDLGIESNKWLMQNGFVPAAMILKF